MREKKEEARAVEHKYFLNVATLELHLRAGEKDVAQQELSNGARNTSTSSTTPALQLDEKGTGCFAPVRVASQAHAKRSSRQAPIPEVVSSGNSELLAKGEKRFPAIERVLQARGRVSGQDDGINIRDRLTYITSGLLRETKDFEEMPYTTASTQGEDTQLTSLTVVNESAKLSATPRGTLMEEDAMFVAAARVLQMYIRRFLREKVRRARHFCALHFIRQWRSTFRRRREERRSIILVQAHIKGFLARREAELMKALQPLHASWNLRRLASCLNEWQVWAALVHDLRADIWNRQIRYGQRSHLHLGANFNVDAIFREEGMAKVGTRWRIWRMMASTWMRWLKFATIDAHIQAHKHSTPGAPISVHFDPREELVGISPGGSVRWPGLFGVLGRGGSVGGSKLALRRGECGALSHANTAPALGAESGARPLRPPPRLSEVPLSTSPPEPLALEGGSGIESASALASELCKADDYRVLPAGSSSTACLAQSCRRTQKRRTGYEASVNLVNPRRNPIGGIRGFELPQGEQSLLQLSLAFSQWGACVDSIPPCSHAARVDCLERRKAEAERSGRLREIRLRIAYRQRAAMRCAWFAWKTEADCAARQRELRALAFQAWSAVTLQVAQLQRLFATKGRRRRVEAFLRAWLQQLALARERSTWWVEPGNTG
ncbi:hypothetical protein CYMTET_35395 [Cymbomonas tetramitiformis]|uniref:Uncharacterized protein n=1 Tax=Cymbomonas tetramitiformis TaxID=36881 RepID=A0AAE0F9B8_9CHLO|nr:hypothetical protein CYMTET_35395 [Cymbomonas tetramitiformis]